jgi:hypothetical protein
MGILPFLSCSVEKGIVPLLSAFIHFYFMEKLLTQTIFLVLMELAWILVKLYCLFKCIYLVKFRVFINLFNCLLRITLLVTLYLFSIGWNQNTMNKIHFYIGICYILFWIVDILIIMLSLVY